MSRSQNVFFCGGNNPLKYIPMWFPIGFSLTLINQDVLIPCGTLKETFAQKPSLNEIPLEDIKPVEVERFLEEYALTRGLPDYTRLSNLLNRTSRPSSRRNSFSRQYP